MKLKSAIFFVFFLTAIAIGWFATSKQGSESDTSLNESDESGVGERTVSDNRTYSANDQRSISARSRPEKTDETIETQDIQTDAAPETERWNDPVNQRVLGPKKWMNERSPEYEKEIDTAFDNGHQERIKQQAALVSSRRASIESMESGVTMCLNRLHGTDPEAAPRVIVRWTATPKGRVKDVKIGANPGQKHPLFLDCIKNLDGTRFDSTLTESINVEYPFMFDEH